MTTLTRGCALVLLTFLQKSPEKGKFNCDSRSTRTAPLSPRAVCGSSKRATQALLLRNDATPSLPALSRSLPPSLNHCHDYRAHLPDFPPGRTMPPPPLNRDITDCSLARFERETPLRSETLPCFCRLLFDFLRSVSRCKQGRFCD